MSSETIIVTLILAILLFLVVDIIGISHHFEKGKIIKKGEGQFKILLSGKIINLHYDDFISDTLKESDYVSVKIYIGTFGIIWGYEIA